MKRYSADDISCGVDHEYGVDVYLVSDVDARDAQATAVIKAQRERIAELERLLDVERRALAAANERAEAAAKWEVEANKQGEHAGELEKSLRRIINAVELFDNEDDGGLSKWDPAVTDAKALF